MDERRTKNKVTFMLKLNTAPKISRLLKRLRDQDAKTRRLESTVFILLHVKCLHNPLHSTGQADCIACQSS